MIVYNKAVYWFIHTVSASTIYSIVYLIYIPLGHLTTILLVFGWPDHYCQSLVNNFPIGLTAIAIGSLLTAYLDQIHFNTRIENYIYDNWTFHKMPPIQQRKMMTSGDSTTNTINNNNTLDDSSSSEFYSSLVVLFITSIWTYILSIWVNRYPTKSEKKELENDKYSYKYLTEGMLVILVIAYIFISNYGPIKDRKTEELITTTPKVKTQLKKPPPPRLNKVQKKEKIRLKGHLQ